MGKKGSWFSKVKKALSTESKEITEQKPKKSKKKWFGKTKDLNQNPPAGETTSSLSVPSYPVNVYFSGAQNEQSKHAFSVAVATTVAAKAAFASAQAAAEVVRLTSVSRYVGKTKEEVAAIRIQTAFRGHMARRALRALKALVRLKSMIHGQSVQRQATRTIHYMQTLAHVQSQIHTRRNRMLDENKALKLQLIQKHEKELERLKSFGGEDWNDSQQSKEKIEASLLSKQQATIRRERGLAYAYSHQTLKNSSKPYQFTFLDISNPQWGWSWLERWMAARPWENHIMSDTELHSNLGSLKSLSVRKLSVGEISKTYTQSDSCLDSNNLTANSIIANHPMNRHTPASLPTKATSLSASRKIKSANTKMNGRAREEDMRSAFSGQSERYRRHSVTGSSVTDEECLVSTPSVPSYMAPTESVKARSRLVVIDNKKGSAGDNISSSGRRMSFTASPADVRKH